LYKNKLIKLLILKDRTYPGKPIYRRDQALDWTQPGLPLSPGRIGSHTHDYKRNGTGTLYMLPMRSPLER